MEKRMYISEITRIAAVGRDNPVEAMEKKGVTSKINDSKLLCSSCYFVYKR